ncbi:IS4 family transposase, partial [Bacillus thuringiensis]|nr:IS4 family transposase [Bacillus thuringiensis]
IRMIQAHPPLLHQPTTRNPPILTTLLIPQYHLPKTNGRKSHRYEKKTIFDIMGVVYEYNGLRKQKKAA